MTTTVDFDLARPENVADPFPFYRYVREQAVPPRDSEGLHVLARYADIAGVLRGAGWSSDSSNATNPRIVAERERGGMNVVGAAMGQLMLFSDPPDHTRLRTLVNKAFTPRAVEAMRPHIAEIVDDLLAAVEPTGGMDVIADFAFPLPVIVIAEMMGVPPGDRDVFKQWAADLARTIDPVITDDVMARAMSSGIQFIQYMGDLIDDRAVHPRDDLLTALAAAEAEGDRLTRPEMIANALLLLIAGHETTMNLIGNGLYSLFRHPDEMARVRADESLAKPAVEEMLRYDGPVQLTVRTALDDHEVGGARVAKGEQVLCLLGAANRDPAAFPDPDRFVADRPDNRHLAFGSGIHFCVGAPLARIEAQVAVPTLLRRYPDLALAVDQPEWRGTFTLRGLSALPVRFES